MEGIFIDDTPKFVYILYRCLGEGISMHVLVTGGAGFIGSHIVEYHLNNHDVVHVLDDLSTGTQENIDLFKNNPNFHFTRTDILTFPEIEKVVCWADRIYHMAAVVGVLRVIANSEKLLTTNIIATERLLRAAVLSKRNPRVLLASTSGVYGDGHARLLQEHFDLIIGGGKRSCESYAISKIAVEAFGLAFYEHYGLAITNLRIFNTIGPRQRGRYGMVVPRFIKSALSNEPIMVYGTGMQTRSFCDVRDLVSLLDKIANNEQTIGDVLNVGQDEDISINALAQLVKKISTSDSDVKHISYDEAYGKGFSDIMFRRPDLTKLHALIAYRYQWDLQSTLTDLITRYV